MKRKATFFIALAMVMLFVYSAVGNAGVTGILHSFSELSNGSTPVILADGVKTDPRTVPASFQVRKLYNPKDYPDGSISFYGHVKKKVGNSWTIVSTEEFCGTAEANEYVHHNPVYYLPEGNSYVVSIGDQLRAFGRSFSLAVGEPMKGFINFN